MWKKVFRSKGKRRRGSEIIEISLLLVPFFGLTFLMLDISLAQWVRSTLQNAVRSGVRYAITGNNDTGPCQDDSIKFVVKSNDLGLLNSATNTQTLHVHFINPVDGSVTDNSFGNVVEVSVEAYPWNPLAAYGHSKTQVLMWARAYDMMEKTPGNPPCITKSE